MNLSYVLPLWIRWKRSKMKNLNVHKMSKNCMFESSKSTNMWTAVMKVNVQIQPQFILVFTITQLFKSCFLIFWCLFSTSSQLLVSILLCKQMARSWNWFKLVFLNSEMITYEHILPSVEDPRLWQPCSLNTSRGSCRPWSRSRSGICTLCTRCCTTSSYRRW